MNKVYIKIENTEISKAITEIVDGYFLDIEIVELPLDQEFSEQALLILEQTVLNNIENDAISNSPKILINYSNKDDKFSKLLEDDKTKIVLYPSECNADFFIQKLNEFKSLPYEMNKDKLFKISLDEYLKVDYRSETSVYLKLANNKFIKIINKNDMDDERLVNYKNKGIFHLYVEDDFYKKYVTDNFFHFLKRSNTSNLGEVQRKVHQAFHALGLKEEQKILVESTINENINLLKKRSDLAKFMNNMKGEGNFLADHSYFTMYLSSWIASLQGWHHEQTLRKIALAAFFHDMSLQDEEHVKFCGTKRQLEKKYMAPTKLDVMLHPMKSASILEEFLDLPDDARNIIQEHHERPDGSGFPTGKSANYISPLSCIFIIAHEVSHFIDYKKNKISPKIILRHIENLKEEGFYKGNFKKIFDSITNYMDEKSEK